MFLEGSICARRAQLRKTHRDVAGLYEGTV